VLLIFSLAYLVFLGHTDFSDGLRWLACLALLVGVLAQSGGMFLHMGLGKVRGWSPGNTLTTAGAVLLAFASLYLAYGVAVSTHLAGI
jgi:hypothetical protein